MDYYKIVIGIATFIFIFTMIFFWYFSNVEIKVFPPTMSNCPTGWKVNTDGTCNIPTDGTNMGNLYGKGMPIYKNVSKDGTVIYTKNSTNGGIKLTDVNGNLILAYTGKSSKFPNFPGGYDVTHPEHNVVDFNREDWAKTESVLCANHKWAVMNNIHWEGVSNYNHC